MKGPASGGRARPRAHPMTGPAPARGAWPEPEKPNAMRRSSELAPSCLESCLVREGGEDGRPRGRGGGIHGVKGAFVRRPGPGTFISNRFLATPPPFTLRHSVLLRPQAKRVAALVGGGERDPLLPVAAAADKMPQPPFPHPRKTTHRRRSNDRRDLLLPGASRARSKGGGVQCLECKDVDRAV